MMALALTLLVVLVVGVGVLLWLEKNHADLIRRDIKQGRQSAEAWQKLYHTLKLTRPLPVTTEYTASPGLLGLLVTLIAETRPRRVVELGSGLSTVVCAYALRDLTDGGELISLDHEAEFCQQTAKLLVQHQLEDVAHVVHAALEPVQTDLGASDWYSTAGLDESPIDLLIVDGPIGKNQPMARYPALAILGARLSPNAVVVLDDANRPDEQRAAELWCQALDLKPEYWDLEKGVTVMRRQSSSENSV